ncbi:MarR family winged helix-turn-helix transcriptional regulator [Microbispora hainanensis]|jgi:DNA-binding MarR family transcriptional regulator|uniref:MarR family winged helix-turn-helix transcriptional regulator n=1 Tax=Microbispora hainanensis TaxID=568844 RepID=A0ABZ1SHS2_9ACTN|nr:MULTISPECIES: MarR family winged helix-turn-helix transcriptional regulator [Microbispora]NJP29845.1 winged helix-turn-helix transcriptional regulator [Microbispora sp. CL1-1]TQS03844.1 winged helix-turn-helix transcriptional regulator [Microbispora sp. SCL1-1]
MTEAEIAPRPPTAGEHEAYCAIERQLAILLRRANAFSAGMGRKVHPELDPGAYGLLVRIEQSSPMRSSDLAAYLRVGRATISRQLKGLEELGLISRSPDPEDGRAHLLALTAEGSRRLGAARSAREGRLRTLLAAWPEEDVRLLAGMLERFNILTEDLYP